VSTPATSNEHEHDTDTLGLDDLDPWAMNLVLRVERDQPVLHDDLLAAAALATVSLLFDPRAEAQWKTAIERWNQGRIRKLCRRARAAKWEQTASLDHVEVTVGTATLRAFVPCSVAKQPKELSRLQLAGTDLDRTSPALPEGDVAYPQLRIWVNPALAMTSAKAAVQVAHGAQLALAQAPTQLRQAWLDAPSPSFEIRLAVADEWATDICDDELVIRDAGFTEIAPNSMTCRARLLAAPSS